MGANRTSYNQLACLGCCSKGQFFESTRAGKASLREPHPRRQFDRDFPVDYIRTEWISFVIYTANSYFILLA